MVLGFVVVEQRSDIQAFKGRRKVLVAGLGVLTGMAGSLAALQVDPGRAKGARLMSSIIPADDPRRELKAVRPDGLDRAQPEIDCSTLLIHCTIQVRPAAVHLYIGLVTPP
jgi:hypothetical protein